MASVHPCNECGGYGPFSKAQKAKGIYERRCVNCVGGGGRSYECPTCGRCFRDQNALNQVSTLQPSPLPSLRPSPLPKLQPSPLPTPQPSPLPVCNH